MTRAAAPPNLPPGPRRRRPRAVGIGQVVGWFAGVVCAYWLYWLIAVPLIEPGIESVAINSASEQDVRAAYEAKSARKQALSRYFPPGSWELDNPAIWETDQTLLLFKDPKPLPDGRVELRHCTLLYFPSARTEGEDARARPIIMRAEEGATLRFDEPIVLKTVDLAKRRLVGGRLNGQITIRREPTAPGAGDDLLITTRDIELKNDRAFSPHRVDFRLGRSRGSGRELEILLAADDGQPGGGFRTGKVRTLLVKRDVKLTLVLDDPAFSRGRRAAAQPELADSTLDIKCQGVFQYDFDLHAASFHDQVDVVRLSTGPSDVLNCQVLTVFFVHDDNQPTAVVPPAKPDEQTGQSRAPADVPIRKIEARGDPVTLRSSARGIYVYCRQGLEFQPIPGDPWGRMAAIGPGVMQGTTPSDAPQKYRVQWTQQFRFQPAEAGLYVASLVGGAKIGVANLGEVTANDRLDSQGRLVEQGRIVAWLKPVEQTQPPEQTAQVRPVSMRDSSPIDGPPGGASRGNSKWQIERVRAQGNVIVDVPQLDGTTNKLEVWVARPPVASTGTVPAEAAPANPPAANGPPPAHRQAPAPSQRNRPTQRFSVRAGSVQARLVPNGEQFDVTDVTLDNQALLKELTPRSGEKPMTVSGARLHVTAANTPQTHVTVVGRPAHLEGGGVILLGEKIELQRDTNHLWVGGPGQMMMPINQDLNGRPLPQPQTAEITWKGRMDFLANRVTYERGVRVMSQQQLLTTEKLEAVLDRSVDFSNPGAVRPAAPAAGGQSAPQLAFVRCYGEAVLDSRQFNERNEQTSIDRMQVFDLAIDRASGDFRANGPGWVRHVGRESVSSPLSRATGRPPNRRPTKPTQPRPGLTYLHVDFQKTVTGNLNRRVLTFGKPTKTVYAPVANWNAQLDADDPKSLGPEGMVMDAEQLTVREMPARGPGGSAWFELVAMGNVLAEGSQFAALAHRATYTQDKDQLVLEGDGRSPAELSYTAIAGGRRNEAKVDKITYLIGRQYVSASGAHSVGLEFAQPPPSNDDNK